MSTAAKALPMAIKTAYALTGEKLGKSATWAQVFDILSDGFVCDVYRSVRPEITTVRLFRQPGTREDLLETFTYPNADGGDDSMDWNLIFKDLTEWLVKNRKKALKTGRKKT